MHEPQLTQMLATSVLDRNVPNIRYVFQPILHITEYSVSPNFWVGQISRYQISTEYSKKTLKKILDNFCF